MQGGETGPATKGGQNGKTIGRRKKKKKGICMVQRTGVPYEGGGRKHRVSPPKPEGENRDRRHERDRTFKKMHTKGKRAKRRPSPSSYRQRWNAGAQPGEIERIRTTKTWCPKISDTSKG